MGEEFNIEEVKGFSVIREVYDWIESGVTALICMILLFTLVGRVIGVVGDSMLPTLEDADRLVTSRLLYTPRYGDIVVVTQPNENNEPLIKRVIATEGQTITVDGDLGQVIVDGQVLDEPYIAEITVRSGDITYPATVPQGHVFVMGDNRNYSLDSRMESVGMVDERYILGKVYYRVLPFRRLGNPYLLSGRTAPTLEPSEGEISLQVPLDLLEDSANDTEREDGGATLFPLDPAPFEVESSSSPAVVWEEEEIISSPPVEGTAEELSAQPDQAEDGELVPDNILLEGEG